MEPLSLQLNLIAFGFDVLRYHKITSRYMASNPASGRVMEKSGMRREGERLDEIFKNGGFHTIIVFGIVNSPERD